jgi:hypothetical protein
MFISIHFKSDISEFIFAIYTCHLFLDLVAWRNRKPNASLELCVDSYLVYQSKIAPDPDLFYGPECPLMLASEGRLALVATCTLQCLHIFVLQ